MTAHGRQQEQQKLQMAYNNTSYAYIIINQVNFCCLLEAMQDNYFPLLILCSLFILTVKWT